jgi:hypothetical protein
MKRVVLIIVLALVVIQFFRPKKNISSQPQPNAIQRHYQVPENTQLLLKNACYDCHSNNTNYPWYNNIQPVAWWLANHVNEGKEHLNFDEFNAYSIEKKRKKLSEISEQIKEEEMPLWSYTLIHTNAKLSRDQQQQIINWANTLRERLQP